MVIKRLSIYHLGAYYACCTLHLSIIQKKQLLKNITEGTEVDGYGRGKAAVMPVELGGVGAGLFNSLARSTGQECTGHIM